MTKIYVKIKFISDDLPLKKTLQICNIIMVGRSAFHEGSKYYLQVFLGKCLNKLKLLYYDRIDISEGTDVNKTSASKERIICHY